MKLWIKKENDFLPTGYWEESYVFSLNRDSYSTMYTNLATTWYHLDQMAISPVYEDLFVIGLSIFSADKRVARKHFTDCWTRELEISIPVLEYDLWIETVSMWEKTLSFLTGDIWKISFRSTDKVYSKRNNQNRKHIDISGCNCVSLFSGGLDSFCGAIQLLKNGQSPCLIGHNEYPKLRVKQTEIAHGFQEEYPGLKVKFISFSANSRAPQTLDGENLIWTENTSRGRSLLFLCAALSIAGIMGPSVPVYIPENGFIGLNLPLTDSRKGTCSTRTTHPYFLRNVNKILETVGINNKIVNFYAYKTKRQIVNSVSNDNCFIRFFSDTISCSHPCQARWKRNGNNCYPINCGYCYPCLIRKSSLLDVTDSNNLYSYIGESWDFLNQYAEAEITSDLRAVLNAVYQARKSSDTEIKKRIKYAGSLTEQELSSFLSVYRSTMTDLEEMFLKDEHFYEYLGIER